MAMAGFCLFQCQPLALFSPNAPLCYQVPNSRALVVTSAEFPAALRCQGRRNSLNVLGKEETLACSGIGVDHTLIGRRVLISRRQLMTKMPQTRALSETAMMDIVESKREIDRVLRKAEEQRDGVISSVSWALYADEETKMVLANAVTKLGAVSQDFSSFLRSKDSLGVWEVFYAPHISRLSSAVGTKINPLQYMLSNSGITSNVRYLSPVGDGWLSAAGDFVVKDGRTVEVLFDSFWWDVGRDNLQLDPKGQGTLLRTLVNIAGTGTFIPALSVYPVHYADSDIVIFEFTILRTKIAAIKMPSL